MLPPRIKSPQKFIFPADEQEDETDEISFPQARRQPKPPPNRHFMQYSEKVQ